MGNIPGWHQVFSDNFNGNRLDRSKWRLYWGKPGGDPAGWFDPRHVFVKNGLLTISAYRDRRDGGRWATGGYRWGGGFDWGGRNINDSHQIFVPRSRCCSARPAGVRDCETSC